MKRFLLLLSLLSSVLASRAQTMTFNSGASEPGFTFSGWSAASGTIWVANLASTATITINSGTFDVTSFYVGPYVGANIMRVQSNLGNTYDYNTASAGTHTLNWTGITTLTFSRVSGSGASADHDNIVYHVNAPCVAPSVPTVTYTPSTVCSGSSATLSISGSLNDATSWHIYTGSCGGTALGTTAGSSFVVTPSSTTTYYVRGEGGCVTPGSCGSTTVNVTAIQSAGFYYGSSAYCTNASDPTPTITGVSGGTFSSSPGGLSLNSSSGTIDLSASTPGPYTVTYTTAGPCAGTSNVSVTINALDNASFSYGASTYCVNASDPTPTITGLSGGTFTSSAGLSINPSTGTIDLSASTPNAYTVVYTTSGSCPNSANATVTVQALDNPSFSYSASAYCVNASDPSPTIYGLGGGTFSSTAGLNMNTASGLIDLSASTPGSYIIQYTTNGSCPNATSDTIAINSLDNPSFSYSSASFCINGSDPTPTITGLSGGTFTSTAGLSINPSTGIIDLSASTPNAYTVVYTTSGSCPNSANDFVTVMALDNPSFSYNASAYCADASDPSPIIYGLGGGTFSSTAGLNMSIASGLIDLSASTPGSYIIQYTTNGSCPNAASDTIAINSLDNPSFSYSSASFCVNGSDPTPTITGMSGGTFTSTAGLSINPSTGTIDLSASTTNPYMVTYTTNGACPNDTSIIISITEADDASFAYTNTEYCIDGVDPVPIVSGMGGGTFSSSAGLVITSLGGVVDLSASTPGNYIIAYTTSGACPNTAYDTLDILDMDNASFVYGDSLYCSNTGVVTAVITGLSGGTFSGPAGLTLDSLSGNFDPAVSTPGGPYTVTYTTQGSCPNSSSQTVAVYAVLTTVTDNSPILTADAAGADMYQWLDCSTMSPLTGEINQSFTATVSGSYAVVVTQNFCNDTSVCIDVVLVGTGENSFQQRLSVTPNPTSGKVRIDLGRKFDWAEIEVSDITGRSLASFHQTDVESLELNIGESAGLYFVRILNSSGEQAVIRVVRND